MPRSRVAFAAMFSIIAASLTFAGLLLAAGEDKPIAVPKVSAFAPADDLIRQADLYIDSLETSVAGEEEFKDDREKVARVGNTLAVIALALGMHDQESKYKASAAAAIKAAQAVAAAKDYAAAKKAVAELREAMDKAELGAGLKWEKVAALPDLMKQVPMVNTRLKKCLKPSKFAKKSAEAAGCAAEIAAIAQASIYDTSEAKNPAQVRQWIDFSAAMRDDAGELVAAVHRADQPAAAKAMKKLRQSCEDCHKVFHPEALDKLDEEK